MAVGDSPTTRLLLALELLQSRGQIPGPELAERLQVDARSLRRYMARLQALGIPVQAERGRHGGYHLRPGYKLPPLMFGEDEAVALTAGLAAAVQLGLAGGGAAAQSAQSKLERVLPQHLQPGVAALHEAMVQHMPRTVPGTARAAPPSMLLALGQAIRARQRLRLRYRAADGRDSEREYDAYGLAFRHGHWYVVGHCHLREALRSLRVDRVEALVPGTATYALPRGFDARQHLAEGLASVPRRHAVVVVLQADLAQVQGYDFAAYGVLQPVPQGVVLRVQADDLDWAARELARLPCGFVVQRPAALRRAVGALARRLLAAVEPG
jgi:predicted DNA-binding transcriptional regulator YafY